VGQSTPEGAQACTAALKVGGQDFLVVGHLATNDPAAGAAPRLADSQRKVQRSLEGPLSPLDALYRWGLEGGELGAGSAGCLGTSQ